MSLTSPSTMNLKPAPGPLDILVAGRTLRLHSAGGSGEFYIVVWRGTTLNVLYDKFNSCIVNVYPETDDLHNLELFFEKTLTQK